MKNSFLAYIIRMIALYALIAFLPLEYSLILGASFFSMAAIASSFGSIAIMTVIGIIMFSFMSVDFLSGALLALSFIVPGIIQGIMIRGRKSLSSVVSVTAIARGALLLTYYNRISGLEKMSIKDLLIGDAPYYLTDKLGEAGLPEEALDLIPQMIEFAEGIIPSTIAISALSFAFLSIGCTKLFAKRTPLLFAGMRKLSDIRLDISFVAITFAVAAISFFAEGNFLLVLINCLYVFYVIYLAAGFAFTYRLIKKGLKHRGASFIISLVIMFASFGIIMPLMGVIGAFFKTDYEQFLENNEKNNESKKDEVRKED